MLLLLFKRFFGKTASPKSANTEQNKTPEVIVAQIRQGDDSLREQFISDYRPYIAKVTSRFCKRYVDPSRDDEFSIALMAFNEAINQFSTESGRSFLGFAETVMRRRLIDFVRKEQRHTQSLPYSSFELQDEDEQTYNPIETKQALQAYELKLASDERKMEIHEYSKELESFGISFMELVDSSPKHADSRLMLLGIASTLAGETHLFEHLRASGKLPIKELTELCGVSRKTVERNRKYIIAVSFLLQGSYPYLYDYLNISEQERDLSEGAGR
ncbi:RNA polymerase sigma factor SigI [Paenibacillus sp. NPDC058174]|uniref:RNA polymerase sigma factor SigI n=1 Tax=Paenibacillus sp. NPDC058174 TaxID=3346366 RepID=UPI0036DB8E59